MGNFSTGTVSSVGTVDITGLAVKVSLTEGNNKTLDLINIFLGPVTFFSYFLLKLSIST
jgi:hypothetical protein